MPDESEQAIQNHKQHMEERDRLIDAARESSRTFDKAVLAFGSAVFGASVAFLKDVAPKPQSYSLPWLCVSWGGFTLGLLAVILSFLFSHKACIARIDEGAEQLSNPDAKAKPDLWGTLTSGCNYLCVALLFLGVVAWVVFAIENLAKPGGTMSESPQNPYQPDTVKKGYTPPRNPPPPPAQSIQVPPPQAPAPKK